ncbi:MAG: hypothetical protein IPM57_08955 [Oligoflexia bacterium]|nr:hypothetical protein [Oligoflexia bacterium]
MRTIFFLIIFLPLITHAQKRKIEKVPKSVFLVKKAKITSDVGEPQFYPAEAQLRTITHDKILHNTKKFE